MDFVIFFEKALQCHDIEHGMREMRYIGNQVCAYMASVWRFRESKEENGGSRGKDWESPLRGMRNERKP